MQNVQKIKIVAAYVLCLMGASFANAKSVDIPKSVLPEAKLQAPSVQVTARFNFEHVRFEFIQLVDESTIKKTSKRKRIAFSNLV